MATQSRAPVILLTRPAAQSARFAKALLAQFPNLTVVTSPLLAPRFLLPQVPDRDWTALILTSETAVEASRRIAAGGTHLPTRAFCVGTQTAAAALAAGFDPLSANGDADDLLSLITTRPLPGPMLHLHGREIRGEIGERLNATGIETVSLVTYAQDLQRLSAEAEALLRRPDPVIAPVFSPRSAAALARECSRIAACAPLSIIAISPSAATAFGAGTIAIASHPDAVAMIAAIASRLNAQTKP